MSSTDKLWRMNVFGAAELRQPDGTAVRTDAKTLILLAYLTVEGPQSRARLAALLWPDTDGGAARNNLVHLLRRLRAASGEDLILADAQDLRLSPAVRVDDEDPERPGPPAPFLADQEPEDALDLADWIYSQREHLLARWLDTQRGRLARLEQEGQLQQALHVAQTMLLADVLAEDAHRAVMRLSYLLGDRPAALRAYHRCKAVLLSEVGGEPSAETVRLAREIDTGSLPVPVQEQGIPLSVLRPPTLVGREAEWAAMEQAWAAGQGIMVIGEPGSGKSRLAVDFLRSKTSHQLLLFEGRPGDRTAPYTTHARTYRQVLDAHPDLDLPDWVRQELSRIIPELGQPEPGGGDDTAMPTPLPLGSEADKLRFYDAKVEMIRRVAERGPIILASDDLQFMDEASIEAGGYVFSKFFGDAQTNLRTLFCFRSGSLTGLAAAVAQQMVDAELAVPVRLRPLDDTALRTLLGDIEVPGAEALAGELQRLTDGNPQFVLETVKSMYETRSFRVEEGLTLPAGDVAAQIRERLGRLSESALRTARAAAILQSGYTLEQVAEVLHIGLLEIAAAWEELELAQVTRGERFAHDLLYETVLTQIPSTTARLLHRSAARVVAAQVHADPLGQQAARVARHWREGGEPVQAAPWLMKAGQAAEATLRFQEAEQFYQAAAELFAASGNAAEQLAAQGAVAASRGRAVK